MDRRGFTIVELIIVITIMCILLTLGVVNLRSTQSNGYDAERKIDIENIALHLDVYYKSGADIIGTNGTNDTGSYPSVDLISQETTMLRDIDVKSLRAPGVETGTSLVASTNTGVITQTTAAVLPQPTISTYVYQPIKDDGTLCTGKSECRKFNLYYKLELATTACPAPDNVCKVTSKNQ